MWLVMLLLALVGFGLLFGLVAVAAPSSGGER
jgi:hypothetical protein